MNLYNLLLLLFSTLSVISCQQVEQKVISQPISNTPSLQKDTIVLNTPLLSGTYTCIRGATGEIDPLRLQIKEYLPNKYYFAINCIDKDSIVIGCSTNGSSVDFVAELKDNRFTLLQKAYTELSDVKIYQTSLDTLMLNIKSESIEEINRILTFRYINNNLFDIRNFDGNRSFHYEPIFTENTVKIPLYQFPDEAVTPQIFELDRNFIVVVSEIYSVDNENPTFALVYFKGTKRNPHYYNSFKHHLWIKISDLYKYYKINKPK